MGSLGRDLRKQLERAVRQARRVAEEGAEKAIAQLGVGEAEAPRHLNAEQKELRKRLRAHGRQLGDALNGRTGAQEIERLVAECAYEHWHRMLFARFLAENDLLIEPGTGLPITLEDVKELAGEELHWLALASNYAQRMLPQIFRMGDPVLEIVLPPEARSDLEDLLKELPRDVFVADDSLGWVYQFWQADRKDEVNESGNKIGADDLPSVTQLFTEDYMVLFLLHNTLGAWWAGKVIAGNPSLAMTAPDEAALRAACKVGKIEWTYLRFVREPAANGTDGPWRPAAGTFDGWPKAAKDITVLDPCMGSGHFLVFALPMLVAFRMAEEGLSQAAAVQSVLKGNLFGLELDPRCTQIGAFNLALAAWRRVGHCTLPAMNVACSGLAPNARKEDWLSLAGDNERLRVGMDGLYRLFQNAPVLGSLINPRAGEGDLFVAAFRELQPLLEKALAREANDDTEHEMAVTARGVFKAAEILASQFTLVATNVPYLGRGKQEDVLKGYCERVHPNSKADLATCFVERCTEFCNPSGSTLLVTPQNWFFLGSYKDLRKHLFKTTEWNLAAKLGPAAFQNMNFWAAKTALCILSRKMIDENMSITGFDASETRDPSAKGNLLLSSPPSIVRQLAQLKNPDARLLLSASDNIALLENHGVAYQGIATADYSRFGRCFWEFSCCADGWAFQQSTVEENVHYGGREHLIFWENGRGSLAKSEQARIQGLEGVGKFGVVVSQMNRLPVSLFTGELFDNNCSALVVSDKTLVPAVWAYCSSEQFPSDVREIDQAVKVTNSSLAKVPFDKAHWQSVAAERYPKGLPKPFSSDPTQWLFNGYPAGADQPLHVAVARLLRYQWPRQTGSSFPDCPALDGDSLERLADDDGIVPIGSVRGEAPAAERLRELLALAYGTNWKSSKQEELLAQVGYGGATLDDWLRNGFFEQHSALFHNRPFIWHVWDGLRDGFHALVNYHRLAAPNGEGRRTLERLIYAYLGDWITRQRTDQAAEVDGADARVAHAEHLKAELIKILEGEPPYDIFVRWKPLHEQAIGWEPDINDGVRLNIRPFMTARTLNARGATSCILRTTPKSIKWDKDRGKEPMREKVDYPWFWGWDEETEGFAGGREFDGNRWNDLHYSNAVKRAARERHKPKAKGKK